MVFNQTVRITMIYFGVDFDFGVGVGVDFGVYHYGRNFDHHGDGFRATDICGCHKDFAVLFDSLRLLEHKTSQ